MVQNQNQIIYILKMQSSSRLIKHIERFACVFFAKLFGDFYPLRLASA